MAPKKSIWLDFFACFLIPAYTLLFAGTVQWFGTNFSVLAVTGPKHYRGFLLWGLMAGSFFLVMLYRLSGTCAQRRQQTWVRGVTVVACGSLISAIMVPYLPAYFPRYAKLHIVLAFAACVLLMVAILSLLLWWEKEGGGYYKRQMTMWKLIVAGSGLIFWIGGMVTTALEVFFTITTTLLVRKLWLVRMAHRNGGED